MTPSKTKPLEIIRWSISSPGNLLFLLSLSISLFSCQEEATAENLRPNIIIILADDLGWNDVSLHGSDIKTPSIDRLASEGLEFLRFYTAPVCSPTRAGLMTGMYPDRFNLRNYVYSPRHLGGVDPQAKMLPEFLKQNGYKRTAAFGKWHLGHSNVAYHPNSNGFDYFYGHYNGAIDYFTHERDGQLDWHKNNEPSFDVGYSTDLIENEVIKFIESARTEEPFFAYVAFNAPHSPMQATYEELLAYGYDSTLTNKEYPTGGSRPEESNLENYGKIGRGNNLRQTYSAMVSSLDKSIGNILDKLKDQGLDDNTIIWFLSDNGGSYVFGGNNKPLRGAKHQEWEGGVRVVSLLRWPGTVEENSKSDQLVAYIDILPTLLDVIGASSDNTFDGISVLDVLKNKKLPGRSIYLGNSGVVTQKWKMNEGQLFKIEEDMTESNNVAEDNAEIVSRLSKEIEKYVKMKSSEEPLLQSSDWSPSKNWTMDD